MKIDDIYCCRFKIFIFNVIPLSLYTLVKPSLIGIWAWIGTSVAFYICQHLLPLAHINKKLDFDE